LALLRLAQGRADAALVAISRALHEVTHKAARTRLLSAAVEVGLAAGDRRVARTAAEELDKTSATLKSAYLAAVAATARGSMALEEGRGRQALVALREALTCWTALDAPYEAARCRLLIARACRAAGDEDSADLEFGAARAILADLCRPAEVDRLAGDVEIPRRSAPESTPADLTRREVEVLRLLATGMTNRAIAEALFLSEKTVARHVANIFMKIDVSTRAAATAFAFAHDLA
jgi:DNA-binding CsgD family transcriptional regulator